MSLIKTIQTEMTHALKTRDTAKLNTLRFIVSQLKYKEIELHRDPSDEETIMVIRKQVKELSDACEQFKAGGRQDLYDENMQQISIMKTYLPQEMSETELSSLVSDYVKEHKTAYEANPRAFIGQVIGALRSKAPPDKIAHIYNKLHASR